MSRFKLPSLPENWIVVDLGKLVEIKYGSALTSENRIEGNVPVYGSGGVVGKHNEPISEQATIIIGRKGSVGSVYLTEGPFWCIDTAFYLSKINEHINLNFLAKYLQSIDLAQLTVAVGVPGLNRADLSLVPVPIPTLSEQQRIVTILLQSDIDEAFRTGTTNLIAQITERFFWDMFGNIFTNDKEWPTAKLGKISNVVRGSSPRPQGDPRYYGGKVPRLMVADVTRDGFWVNATTDSLTDEGASLSRLMPAGSVIIVVSGAPGVTAILNHDACIHDGFAGLRDLDESVLPEYVAYTLNTFKARSDQQAVGAVFRNLTTDQLRIIEIPIPPIELQERFKDFLFLIRAIKEQIDHASALKKALAETLKVSAFSGELTETWRNKNEKQISSEAEARAERLALISKPRTPAKPPAAAKKSSPAQSRPARLALFGELSEFQRFVFGALSEWSAGILIPDDSAAFESFCRQWPVEHERNTQDRARRALDQLAALGLIAKVSLPNPQGQYLTAYRMLREEDERRTGDIAAIGRSREPA